MSEEQVEKRPAPSMKQLTVLLWLWLAGLAIVGSVGLTLLRFLARHGLVLSLLFAPALALADVTVNGTVSAYILDGGVRALDEFGNDLRFIEHRVDTARDIPMFADRFTGVSVAAHNKWAQNILTQTVTVGAGAMTLNASAITTINTYSTLLSVEGLQVTITSQGSGSFVVRSEPRNGTHWGSLPFACVGN